MKARTSVLLLLVPVLLLAQGAETPTSPGAKERPLLELPYTPGLDVSSMDTSADPCVDFYQYTCGGWMKKNPIPPDQSSWSVYGKLYDENTRFLWGILDEAAKPGADRSGVTRQIGDYFASCMDEATIERAGASPLAPGLGEIAALGSVTDLVRFVAREHMAGAGSAMLFGFGSNQDFGDSTRVIAFVTAGGPWASGP